MNKDFFNKQISLKDIKVDKNFFKNIKNKKEILVTILVLIYIVVIFVIGNKLIVKRKEAKLVYESKTNQCERLKNSPTEEKLKDDIEKLNLEKEKLATQVTEIEEVNDSAKIIKEFKDNSPIKWDKETVNIENNDKGFEDYEVLSLRANSFSGTYKEIEEFLEYVKNYDKIVRVNSLSFRENNITGRLSGDFSLSFYFKKAKI